VAARLERVPVRGASLSKNETKNDNGLIEKAIQIASRIVAILSFHFF